MTDVTSGLLHAWGGNAVLLLKLAWLCWALWGIGALPLRALAPGPLAAAERLVLSAGLGTGTLSLVLLGMGAGGLYHRAAFSSLVALLSLLAAAATWQERRALREAARQVRTGAGAPSLVWLLAGGAGAAGLTALAPPLFYDALVHHLGVPNLFLLRGGIEYLPHIVHSNFPMGIEMVYLFALELGAERLAGLAGFSLWVLAAAALAAFARRHWGRRAALAAAALFYLSVPVFLLSRYATVENGMCLYFVLTLLCLFRGREDGRQSWVLLAGVFAGFFFSVKYVGGLFGVLLPLLILGVAPGGRTLAAWLRQSALFLFAAGAVSVPWLVKNLLFTGNPVHPAFSTLLGGKNWGPAEAASFAADALSPWSGPLSWGEAVRLPLDLVLNPGRFAASANNTWFWPLTAAALVVLLFARRRWQERALLTLLGGYALLWGGSFWVARFLLPAMTLGALLIALALEKCERRLPSLRLPLVVALLAAVNFLVISRDLPTSRTLRPALGLQSSDDYLASRLRIHGAVLFINRTLPPLSQVLVMGETRVAYLKRGYLHQSALDRPILPALVGGARTPERVAGALRAAGVTHILINLRELQRLEKGYPVTALDPGLKEAFARFLNSLAVPLYVQGPVFVYSVPPPAAAPPEG